MNIKICILLIGLLFFTGCSSKFKRVSEEQFIGIWKLEGRPMFDSLEIDISRNEKGILVGRINKLNNKKYIKMFASIGDIWIGEISRSSNYQFKITEKRIAYELFSLYGLSTKHEFKAVFIDKNTIGISDDGNPSESSIRYKRIE